LNLLAKEFLFFDCQSTGASPANGNVLEMAWCQASATGKPKSIQAHLVKQPGDQPVPYMIQAITGIFDNEMAAAIHLEDAYGQFSRGIQKNPHLTHALIHYARFEEAFLKDLQNRFRSSSQLPFRVLCTYEIARRLFPNLPTRGIKGIAGFFGATIPDTKRSSCHVEATWTIWKGLVAELSKRGINTVDELETWLSTVPAAKRTKLEYPLDKNKRMNLPDKPGVYRMLDYSGTVLYVGKATSLKSRVNSYFRGKKGKDSKRLEMMTRVCDLKVTVCDTALEAAVLESDEIKRLNPHYNVVLKTGRRQLIYYNRALTEWKPQPDQDHTIGPFPGPFMMEPLIRLSASLQKNEFDPHIFFDFVEPNLITEGFAIFQQLFELPQTNTSPRALMAFALQLYKEEVRLAEEELDVQDDYAEIDQHGNGGVAQIRAADTESDVDEIALDLDDVADFDPVLSPAHEVADVGAVKSETGDRQPLAADDSESEGNTEELTANDVAGKFQRLFLRAARAYLQARALRCLLESSVEFCDQGVSKSIRVRNGKLMEAEQLHLFSSSHAPVRRAQPKIDLTTFDRMRVLLAELSRIKSSGSHIKIESDLGAGIPQWLIGRAPIA
jgi:DNA polymerase III subunit epsilon